MSSIVPIEPRIVHDVGQARPKHDARRTAIAAAMSRAHVRLGPEQQQDFCAALLYELDRLTERPLPEPVAPAVLELVPPLEPVPPVVIEHECPMPEPCDREHVENDHNCNDHCTLEHVPAEKDWSLKRRNRVTDAKNPAPGKRVCSLCKQTKSTAKSSTGLDGGEFVLHREKGGNKLSSRCRECLNSAARNRYLSAQKLQALNMARLEFIVDKGEVGLRCLGCGEDFEVGDKAVAEAGLRHTGCIEEPEASEDDLAALVAAANETRASL